MKKSFIVFISLSLIGFLVYKFIYKSHRKISEEVADHKVSVSEIHQEFITNDSLAYAKYLDNTIEVYGKITDIDTLGNLLVLDEKVVIMLLNKQDVIQKYGQNIKVKGRFIGYDDLLDELKIDQAILIP